MIYAAIRFIPEWAHALTLVNFSLIGLASGSVLFCALAFASGLPSVGAMVGPWALTFTVLAAASRGVSLWRNARLQPKSSLQSALGVTSPRIVQKSMGMMGGSFNTREFFHGAQPRTVLQIRWAFFVLTFGAPAALMALALGAASGESLSAKISCIWCLAALSQWPGLALERWAFLAETSHPQNLYYQNVG
jgi:DMSO reductase anchor subunit